MTDEAAERRRLTAEEWQKRYAHVVGRRVAHYRAMKGMRAEAVSAALLSELGVEMKRTVIGNLESGYRKTVSVAEILALAHVLRVPPLALMVPLDGDESSGDVEILPGVETDPWSAAGWITGEGRPCAGGPEWRLDFAGRQARETLNLYRTHDDALQNATFCARTHDFAMQELAAAIHDEEPEEEKRATAREKAAALRDADSYLRGVRDLLAKRGLRLPTLDASTERRLSAEPPPPRRMARVSLPPDAEGWRMPNEDASDA